MSSVCEYSQRPEEQVGPPGSGVIGKCEQPYMGAENQTRPLEELLICFFFYKSALKFAFCIKLNYKQLYFLLTLNLEYIEYPKCQMLVIQR